MTDVLRYAAFTSQNSGGNPAGVVLEAGGLDDEHMRRIAADVGYSETAFVTPIDVAERHYRVRYFSPVAEIAFCGHATVATAVALAEREGTGDLVFETQAGTVPVRTSHDGTLHASLTSVPTRSRAATETELNRALDALGWSVDDLDPAWPAHVAFAGNDHLVLAAGNRERLAALDYDFDALTAVMRDYGWSTLHLFWRRDAELVHARDPFPIGGVVEDPATGAAAAAFGGYLRAVTALNRPARLTIMQGEDMGRPSRLVIDIAPDDPRVTVTGAATRIAREEPDT